MSDENFAPWTREGASRLRVAAAELAAAVTVHAEAVAAVTTEAGLPRGFAASEHLLPAVLEYAEAQFAYTGNGFPFGVVAECAEDEGDEDEDAGEEDAPGPAAGFSVLQRHDYQVVDEAAVILAGRRAYLDAYPGDREEAASADVSNLGRALYQIAHAAGWHGVSQVEGLRPTGGRVVVVDQEETLGPDPDEWPEDVFTGQREPMYVQEDVFPA